MTPDQVRLLLVEDNPGDARLIQETLAESKLTRFAITRAGRLDEALTRLGGAAFDAVLLDLTLPDSRGLDTLKALRAAFPSVPVVILTGFDGEDAGVLAVKEGAQDYLVKGEPAAEAVVRVIRHAIERAAALRDLRESEDNYRRLFDAVADPLVVLDPATGETVDVNRVAEVLYGYSRAELLGRAVYMLSAQPEETRASVSRMTSSDREIVPYRLHRRKDGSVFPVEIHSSYFTLKGRRLAINAVRDISERQKTADLLADERARLLEAQAVAKIGSWETDLSSMNVVWSEQTHRIFGTDPETYRPTHHSFLTFVHPDDRERVDAAFLASLASRERHVIEHRVLLADGRVKIIEERWQIHSAPSGGRPARAVGTCQDVTERAVAQRLVAESNARFKRMAESISQVFWMTDLDKNTMIYVSPAYETIWGRTCDSLYENPRTWLDAILPEDRSRVAAALPAQVRGGYDEIYRICRPDGEVRWIRDRAFPVKDENGRVYQVTGVAQDVTKEIKTEASLLQTQEFLEKAQEVADTGSWINPLDGGELVWSKQCRRIFGVPQDASLHYEDLLAMIHPQDVERLKAARDRAVSTGTPYSLEMRIVRRDGATRWISVRAELNVDKADGVRRLVGVVRDITASKDSERRLKEAEDMLRQSQKMEAMGRLAGGVAHDFNNILTAILGLSEMVIAGLPKDSSMREDVEEIRQSGLRAANLTQQLLAFSRRQVNSPRLLNIDDVVAGLSKMLRRIIGEHVELVLEPGAAGAPVRADLGQIEQLIMNLVVNARDALPKGGRIVIRTGVETLDGAAAAAARVAPGKYVALSVTDTGTGMSDEVLAHLFEPFYTTKEKGKGTGLGLSTVYGVVKQSGGEISVRSAEGRGTTFRILLPCASGSAAPDAPVARRAGPSGGETILLVEDEEPVRRLTGRILRGLGYEVVDATSGADGLERLKADSAGKVSLLLTDMIMPSMSGWDLARLAAEVRPGLPVLFVSGYTADTFADMCILDEHTDILAKPFTAEELGERVRRALDRVAG